MLLNYLVEHLCCCRRQLRACCVARALHTHYVVTGWSGITKVRWRSRRNLRGSYGWQCGRGRHSRSKHQLGQPFSNRAVSSIRGRGTSQQRLYIRARAGGVASERETREF
jgi:hypothetical protein